MTTSDLISFIAAVVLLAGVAFLVGHYGRLGTGKDVWVVVVRAIVQLLAVALVIKVIFETAWLAPIYLTAMLAIAANTSSRRLRTRGVQHTFWFAAAAIFAGAGITVAVIAATRALPLTVNEMVPFAAQEIGGAMTATTLASMRLLDDVHDKWDEVEGWLALGATSEQAVIDLGRRAAANALVPALDQTRNVGLVVLPGAFVGLLLAGASPVQAGRIQLLVLVGLICAESVAALIVTRLLGTRLGRLKPTTLVKASA